jgi:hypothetical protein
MQVFTRGSAFQNLHQNQTGKVIGLFCVIGIFKRHIANGRYELSQRGMDPVVITVYFHVGFLSLRENRNDPKFLLKRGADARK